MSDSILWKVIGKMDGGRKVFYSKDPEFVNTPSPDDIVELESGEHAIVYKRNGEVRLFTESQIFNLEMDLVSYRNQ